MSVPAVLEASSTRWEHRVLVVLGLALAGVLLWAAVLTPLAPVVIGVAAFAVVLLVLQRPEVGALAMVMVAAIPRDTLFERDLPFLGGGLKVTDLLLVLTLGSYLLGHALRDDLRRLPSRPVTVLVGVLLALAAVSLLTGRLLGTPTKIALLELRPLLSYLLVFPLVAGVRDLRTLERGLTVFLGTSVLVSAQIVWLYLEGVGTSALFAGGSLRVENVVFLYPLMAFVWALVLLVFVRPLWARVGLGILAAVSVAAVFFTFQRGSWLGGMLAAVLVLVLLPRRRRWRLLTWSMPLLLSAAVVILVFNSASARAAGSPLAGGLERLSSLGAVEQDVSSLHRFAEWERAFQAIGERPLTGIGLGGTITFRSPLYSEEFQRQGAPHTTFYIHNSYIWFTLKLGVGGLLAFVTLMGVLLRRALRASRATTDPRRQRLLLGALGSLVTLMVMSLTGPHANLDNSVPYIAATIAVVELASRLPAGPEGVHADDPEDA